MNNIVFRVDDKVTLIPDPAVQRLLDDGAFRTVPKLVAGRVYCVEKVNHMFNKHWLRLVGHRPIRRPSRDDRGTAAYIFQLVSRAEGRREQA